MLIHAFPVLFLREIFLEYLVQEIHICGKALFIGANGGAIPHRGSQTPEAVVPSQLHLAKLFSDIAE